MRPGTRVAGMWVVEGELPAVGELRRFRVRAHDDPSRVAEAVTPVPHALLRPGVREAFLGLPSREDFPTLATDVVDGAPVRVRPLTRGSFGNARISPKDAVHLAAWLRLPIATSNGAALGELDPEDLVLDEKNVVHFAPSGIPRAASVARAPHHRAPEGTASAAADLYGLGVTLYRAVTGALPGTPPAPASSFGVSAEADTLLAALLSPDPAIRVAAINDLDWELAEFRYQLPTDAIPAPAPPTPAPSTAIRTTAPPPPAVPATSAPLLPWAVLVPLKGLSPAQLRVVAARSVADPEAVRRAAARGATWCVDTAQTEAEAGRIRHRLEVAGVPQARLATTAAPRVVQYLLLAVVSVVIGFVSGLLLPFGGIAAILVYMAVVNVRAMFAVAEARMNVQERDRATLPESAPEARVRALRRRVAAAELPEIVLGDLRQEVSRLETRLDTLRAHEAELAGATDATLKARQEKVADELAAVEAEITRVDTAIAMVSTADLDETPAPTPPALEAQIEEAPPRPREPTKA